MTGQFGAKTRRDTLGKTAFSLVPHRNRLVTDEHLVIGKEVLHRPLASPLRRAIAMSLDLILLAVFGTPIYIILMLGLIHLQEPRIMPALYGLTQTEDEAEQEALIQEIQVAAIELVARKNPAHLPRELRDAVKRNDEAAILESLKKYNVFFDLSRDFEAGFDETTNYLRFNRQSFIGSIGSVMGYLSLLLAYFTILTWLGKGRTPGKRLAKVRVVRLDGKPLRLWDSFGRAGGYSASLSTLGIGFLEVFWNPNRQTVHDRIAETVVITSGNKRTLLGENAEPGAATKVAPDRGPEPG